MLNPFLHSHVSTSSKNTKTPTSKNCSFDYSGGRNS